MIIDLRESNMTINEALFIAKPYDVIILDDKTYYEKIKISTPNLTMIGSENTKISWDDYNGKIIPISDGGDGVKKYGTTTSATFTVAAEAINFKAEGITFVNTHILPDNDRKQAVAFKSESSGLIIDNCRFISKQDTLYLDYGFNNLIKNSYVEGDIDFVFGSADVQFTNCKFKAVNVRGKAYFTAPDTFVINDNGFVFDECLFYADEDFEIYLGRAWYPSGANQPVLPKMTLNNCEIKGTIKPYFIKMHEKDPDDIELEIINTDYNGEKINKIYKKVI